MGSLLTRLLSKARRQVPALPPPPENQMVSPTSLAYSYLEESVNCLCDTEEDLELLLETFHQFQLIAKKKFGEQRFQEVASRKTMNLDKFTSLFSDRPIFIDKILKAE